MELTGKEIRALIQCVYVARSHSIDRKVMPINRDENAKKLAEPVLVPYNDLVKKLVKIQVEGIITEVKERRKLKEKVK